MKCPVCDSFLLSLYYRKGNAAKKTLKWLKVKEYMYCDQCDKIIEVDKK